ncbi:MAG TPA: hypothetical protein VGL38_07120 [bacterium]|jgi:hypothetical protein
MSAKEKLLDFIRYAGATLGFDDLEEPELELDVERLEDVAYPAYCTDILREETNEVYRFCFVESLPSLAEQIPFFFEQYRELESVSLEEYDGAVLFVKTDTEDQDFWYVYRTETGEIGLFHSDYSLDEDGEDGEDDDEDLDDHLKNGKE